MFVTQGTGSCIIPKRFIFCFVGILASTLAVSLNTNFSMAIVSMEEKRNLSHISYKYSNECLSNERPKVDLIPSIKKIHNHKKFKWSPEMEGQILGAVYYGQLFGFLPGGRMAEIYGGKRTLIIFLAVSSFCTALIPITAHLSVYALIVCRFLIGFATAPVLPILFYLISRWIPYSERSFTSSFVLAGYGLGAFLSFISSGVLCASDFLGGWPAVFYTGALSGFVWCCLCYLLVYDTPKDHPTITLEELEYIAKHLPVAEKQIKTIPWKSIMTSVPFWALAVGYFGQFWILGFYCTAQPLYMGTILHLDSVTNGLLSSVPPLCRALFACMCGFPADWAVKRGHLSVGFIRKSATLSNSILACLGFLGVSLIGCDPQLNTIFFTAGGLLGDFITFGVCMAGVDIAPNLSGTVSGILSFVGVIPFFIIPAIIGWRTKYERSMAQWNFIYYITIGVVIVTTVVYLVFGTSEPQSWRTDDNEDASEDNSDHKRKNSKDSQSKL